MEESGLNIYNLYAPCDGGVPGAMRSEMPQGSGSLALAWFGLLWGGSWLALGWGGLG